MRFSLKWALAAMAYVALAATAFSSPAHPLNLLLWGAALTAFAYSILLIVVVRGRVQLLALGFVVTSGMLLSCYCLAPSRRPSLWFFPPQRHVPGPKLEIPDYEAELQRFNIGNAPPSSIIVPFVADYHRALRGDAANAIGIMAAGLIGCGLGALAYRRGRPIE